MLTGSWPVAGVAGVAAPGAPATAVEWALLWRRCVLLLLLLAGLASLPAALLGSLPPAPLLRASYPALQDSWGPAVARAWVRGALLLPLPGGAPPEDCRDAACGVFPAWLARSLPYLRAAADAGRAWPLRWSGHLWALALWLGLLQPLAWSLLRWRRRQVLAAYGREFRPEDGAAPAQAGSAGPLLVVLTLLWSAMPPGSERWAPALAGAWLALRCWRALLATA